ncbi:hypothetical protein M9M90_00900 [Phenylobacterium sp. LH3H17]|uniref:hypothetical protein n=1 Tax=Phenylobacterium sp. LH3H17 TaxID=2903901 RepID=UPI0020C967A9|nr:hypothetical protein [Phenylobacterium sp. LH3H17]UTP39766.1 hypothetical protein M9M90_00900 [Phenylobacterium sp. LH3H17]
MQSRPKTAPLTRDTLSLKLGTWFEAHATGTGVIAIPVVLLILIAGAAMKLVVERLIL